MMIAVPIHFTRGDVVISTSWLIGIALPALLCGTVTAQTPLSWFERELIDPRSRFGFADDPHRGRLVLFGGSTLQGDTWEWDGQAWTKRTLEASPPGRQREAAKPRAMAHGPRRAPLGGTGAQPPFDQASFFSFSRICA